MKILDLTGKKYHWSTVSRFSHMKNGQSYWVCRCRCGKTFVSRSSRLKGGNTKSCGCYNRQRASRWLKFYANSDAHKGKGNPMYMHGESLNPLFPIFTSIKHRTTSKKSTSWKYYGKLGVKCEWKNFLKFKKDMEKSFLEHVAKFGRRQTTIERINPFGNYSKANCKWATYKEQRANRRDSHARKGLPN